ncbi:uncharacterized protein LOC141745967 [Larus michahellis]|uniref:uncharacterized protein LOC141745967 n=1 Tax=Larus michahellis TaxID=119627 RepID=UPI003D9BE85E
MAGGRAGPAAPEEGTEAAGGLYGGGGGSVAGQCGTLRAGAGGDGGRRGFSLSLGPWAWLQHRSWWEHVDSCQLCGDLFLQDWKVQQSLTESLLADIESRKTEVASESFLQELDFIKHSSLLTEKLKLLKATPVRQLGALSLQLSWKRQKLGMLKCGSLFLAAPRRLSDRCCCAAYSHVPGPPPGSPSRILPVGLHGHGTDGSLPHD